MKRITAFIIALTLSAGMLSGCGSTGSTDKESSAQETTTTTITTAVQTTTTTIESDTSEVQIEDSKSDKEYLKQYITDYVNTLQEHYPEIGSTDEELVISDKGDLNATKVVTLNEKNYSINVSLCDGKLYEIRFGLASGEINGVNYSDWNTLYNSYFIDGDTSKGHIESVEQTEKQNRDYTEAVLKLASVVTPNIIDDQSIGKFTDEFFKDLANKKEGLIFSKLKYDDYMYELYANKVSEGYIDTYYSLVVCAPGVLKDSDDVIHIVLDDSGNANVQEVEYPDVDESTAFKYADLFSTEFENYISELRKKNEMPVSPESCEAIDLDGTIAVGRYTDKIRSVAKENNIHGFVYLVYYYDYTENDYVLGIYYTPKNQSDILGIGPNVFWSNFNDDVKTFEDDYKKWDNYAKDNYFSSDMTLDNSKAILEKYKRD